MASWLHKLMGTVEPDKDKGQNLVARGSNALTPMSSQPPALSYKTWQEVRRGLPNASIIYGATGVLLGVGAFYHIVMGRWLTGILVGFISACFFGYAWHFYRYR